MHNIGKSLPLFSPDAYAQGLIRNIKPGAIFLSHLLQDFSYDLYLLEIIESAKTALIPELMQLIDELVEPFVLDAEGQEVLDKFLLGNISLK